MSAPKTPEPPQRSAALIRSTDLFGRLSEQISLDPDFVSHPEEGIIAPVPLDLSITVNLCRSINV